MKIEITYKVSETERHIYEFEVYSKKNREHVSTMIAHRDGVGDVWGDKWSNHFEKEMEEEIKEFEDCYESYKEVCAKYNPCTLKTKHGKVRYSGCSFGGDTPKRGERYGLVPSDERINRLIDKEIVKKYLC